MPLIDGPELDKIKKELVEWYLNTRAWLIEAMESGGYPYGNRQLSPSEQIERFLQMTPEEWDYMESRLMERYRGRPNQRELVEADLKDYSRRMTQALGGVR